MAFQEWNRPKTYICKRLSNLQKFLLCKLCWYWVSADRPCSTKTLFTSFNVQFFLILPKTVVIGVVATPLRWHDPYITVTCDNPDHKPDLSMEMCELVLFPESVGQSFFETLHLLSFSQLCWKNQDVDHGIDWLRSTSCQSICLLLHYRD